MYREMVYKEMPNKAKRAVVKAKMEAYNDLYQKLNTREGEKELYRLARQRDKAGKDVQQIRVVKESDGRVLTSQGDVLKRWKEYFKVLMNEENTRESRTQAAEVINREVTKISEA